MSSEQGIIKDKVHATLKAKKVKLWEGVYVDSQGKSIDKSLEQLAEDWNTSEVLISIQGSEERVKILQALKDLQSHAIAKLKAKQFIPCLEVKLLGQKEEIESIDPGRFAKKVNIDGGSSKNNIVITLQDVDSKKTGIDLLEFLTKLFPSDNPNIRLIYQGKNIIDAKKSMGTLFRTSMDSETKVSLLCLVSHVNSIEQERMKTYKTIQDRISAIRDAANQIRDSTKLEITDQNGNIVPMEKEDRLGFLTALALHRLGLNSTTQQEKLTLLLEADVEWNNHPRLTSWKMRVDNYGLLQLDIAWMYLQLESLSNLPDSLRRLEEAEKVLRKQVHVNFITLALTQAEMGNFYEVPPLAAVFAKLFLLQGIAYLCDSNVSQNHDSGRKSEEKLNQAFLLLQSLRSVSPEESVQQLMNVMPGRRASDAIAALRKSHGNIHAAASTMASDETERQQRLQDRRIQHQYGICQNERDPVNITQLEILKPLLKGWRSNDAANLELAVGLLRMADNDLQRSLELYAEQEYNQSKIHILVNALDERLVQRGLMGEDLLRKKKKARTLCGDYQPVDEMTLVSLVSMGIDPVRAKTALRNNGNDLEKAMLWLSVSTTNESDIGKVSASPTTQHDDSNRVPGVDSSTLDNPQNINNHNDLRAGRNAGRNAGREAGREAQELLHKELENILEDRDLEEEYLGNTLEQEWQLVQKYRKSA